MRWLSTVLLLAAFASLVPDRSARADADRCQAKMAMVLGELETLERVLETAPAELPKYLDQTENAVHSAKIWCGHDAVSMQILQGNERHLLDMRAIARGQETPEIRERRAQAEERNKRCTSIEAEQLGPCIQAHAAIRKAGDPQRIAEDLRHWQAITREMLTVCIDRPAEMAQLRNMDANLTRQIGEYEKKARAKRR